MEEWLLRKGGGGVEKNKKLQSPLRRLQTSLFFLRNAPSIFLTLSALHPSLRQSQSRLAQALAGEASSIDPIKLVVGSARLEELSPKPIV